MYYTAKFCETAAARRRQRRLRAYLRYARMSVAMALAESTHHTSRGQQLELFQLYEEEPGGSRPPCPGEPWGPQEKVQQCTVEQLADVVPMVQILDTPGLLGEGIRWWRCCGCSTCRLVEQVIAVPKISLDRVPQRSAIRRPQKVETEPGYSLAGIAVRALGRRAATALAEQTADNPVPQGRREGGPRSTSRTGFNSGGRGAYL